MKANKKQRLMIFVSLMIVIGVIGALVGITSNIDLLILIGALVVWLIVFLWGTRIIVTTKETKVVRVKDVNELYRALGGSDNVVSIDHCVTRVKLVVKDSHLVDEEMVRKVGVVGIIKPSNTSVQLITKDQTLPIYESLRGHSDV